MERNLSQPLILERVANWLIAKAKENVVPLLASAIFGILAYMFAFANKLVNHDEVQSLFMKGATVDSGRWGLGALDSIFPNYSMPWIYGIITIALMAVSVCVIIHIFSIRSKLLQALLAGSIVVFPSLIGTFGYMFTSSSYAVSFLMAILAVWFIQKSSKLCALPALVCMIGSLSIYQSYIAVAASLLVLVLIRQLLHEDNALPVILRGIYFVAFLILSLGLYYIATQAVLFLKDIEFNSYTNENVSFSLSSIPVGIALAYDCFFRFISEGYCGLVPTDLSRVLHQLLLIAAAVLFLIWGSAQKKKSLPRFLLLAVLIAILPLAINCMYLITTAESIHTLVLYGFVAVYILAAVIAEECLTHADACKLSSLCRRAALNTVTFALAVIVVINTYIANESYLNLYLRYENAYAFYTALVADIKMMPEFDETTKLAVIGNFDEPDYYEEQFAFSNHLTGIKGFKPDSYSNARFLEYYLGISIPFAAQDEIDAIVNSPEYAEMAVYPYYGSMRLMGDVLVVKLS